MRFSRESISLNLGLDQGTKKAPKPGKNWVKSELKDQIKELAGLLKVEKPRLGVGRGGCHPKRLEHRSAKAIADAIAQKGLITPSARLVALCMKEMGVAQEKVKPMTEYLSQSQ